MIFAFVELEESLNGSAVIVEGDSGVGEICCDRVCVGCKTEEVLETIVKKGIAEPEAPKVSQNCLRVSEDSRVKRKASKRVNCRFAEDTLKRRSAEGLWRGRKEVGSSKLPDSDRKCDRKRALKVSQEFPRDMQWN